MIAMNVGAEAPGQSVSKPVCANVGPAPRPSAGSSAALGEDLAVFAAAGENTVGAGREDQEAGGGADEQGVDVDREGLHQALLGRVRYFCGGRGVRDPCPGRPRSSRCRA